MLRQQTSTSVELENTSIHLFSLKENKLVVIFTALFFLLILLASFFLFPSFEASFNLKNLKKDAEIDHLNNKSTAREIQKKVINDFEKKKFNLVGIKLGQLRVTKDSMGKEQVSVLLYGNDEELLLKAVSRVIKLNTANTIPLQQDDLQSKSVLEFQDFDLKIKETNFKHLSYRIILFAFVLLLCCFYCTQINWHTPKIFSHLQHFTPIIKGSIQLPTFLSLIFFSIVFNFKFFDIYISFFFTSFLAVIGMYHFSKLKFFDQTRSMRSILLASVIFMAVNSYISFSGYTFFAENFIKNWIKLITILSVCYYSRVYLKLHSSKIKSTYTLITVFALSASIKCVWENYNSLSMIDWNLYRPDPKWIGGPNQFASITGIGIMILLSNYFYNINRFLKLTMLCTLAFATFISMSRGAVYSLLMVLLIYLCSKGFRVFIKFISFAILNFIIFDYLFQYSALWSNLKSRYLLINTTNSSTHLTSGRSEIWEHLLSEYARSPLMKKIFGNGVGTFYFDRYFDAHSTYLQFLWEFGIIGLGLLFFSILYLYLPYLKKLFSRKKLTIESLCLLFILSNMMFEDYHYSTQTGWIIGLFLGIFLNTRARESL